MTIRIADISNDRSMRLICDADFAATRYEPHDGEGAIDETILAAYLEQLHYVAAVKYAGADENGLILGPHGKADPNAWQRLGRITRGEA